MSTETGLSILYKDDELKETLIVMDYSRFQILYPWEDIVQCMKQEILEKFPEDEWIQLEQKDSDLFHKFQQCIGKSLS